MRPTIHLRMLQPNSLRCLHILLRTNGTQYQQHHSIFQPTRSFSSNIKTREEEIVVNKAKGVNQEELNKHENKFHQQTEKAIREAKELQARAPWHREGSDKPPVQRNRKTSVMTKGPLLASYFSKHQLILGQ
jgi:GTPase involved in cell partitioning and DNA repair